MGVAVKEDGDTVGVFSPQKVNIYTFKLVIKQQINMAVF